MSISKTIKENKFLTAALAVAFLNMLAIFAVFGFQHYGDSVDYFRLINWLLGEGSGFDVERMLRPMGPFLALPFESLDQGAGLIIQNIIFYLLAAFLIFKTVELIYQNKKQAFWAVLFFVTATPVIESGLAYLTDMGAWFFYLLSLYLTLLYLKDRKENLVLLNGFLSGIAVLMKENGGLGAIFFGLMILFSKGFNFGEKIWKIAKFAGFFLLPIIILQVFAYQYFHYTSLDWYLRNAAGSTGEGPVLTLLRYLGQLFRILGILWIPLIFGLWREVRSKNWQRLKIYLALLPASFSFLLWSVSGSARAVFIFAPLGILLASFGFTSLIDSLGKKARIVVISLFILALLGLNYAFCYVNREVPFTDILYNFFQ